MTPIAYNYTCSNYIIAAHSPNNVLTNFAKTLSGTFLGVGHKVYEEE